MKPHVGGTRQAVECAGSIGDESAHYRLIDAGTVSGLGNAHVLESHRRFTNRRIALDRIGHEPEGAHVLGAREVLARVTNGERLLALVAAYLHVEGNRTRL